MKIRVTQADIEAGRVGNAYACPIAIAVKRTTALPYVRVARRIYACDENLQEMKVWRIPSEAHDFITMFDNNQEVLPIEFEI